MISVITPVYNAEQFLDIAISSVLSQDEVSQYLIIDDGSTDNSVKVIESWCKKDNRIKLLQHEDFKNHGRSASRNLGIKIAKSKYIAFLDADDFWSLNKIELQIKYMQDNNLYCSHTSYNVVNIERVILAKRTAKFFHNFEEILKSCDIGLSTVVIQRTIFSEYCKFPNIKTKEDFVLWLKILKTGYAFGAIDEQLCFWRNSKNSLSSSTFQKLIDGFKVYYTHMNYKFFKSLYLLACLSLNYLKKK